MDFLRQLDRRRHKIPRGGKRADLHPEPLGAPRSRFICLRNASWLTVAG